MHLEHKLRQLEQRHREAKEIARKTEAAVFKFHVRQHLKADAEYQQLLQKLKEVKRALHRSRLSITKKTKGLEIRRVAIERMEKELQQDRYDETRLVQELHGVDQKRTAIASRAKRRVIAEKQLSDDLLKDPADRARPHG